MIIYKDVVSGDELFSDTFPMEVIHDGIFYKVKGKHVTETTDIDESAIGGNASAEGGDEGAEASSVSGVNIVLSGRLVEVPFGKSKDYQLHLKEYFKAVVAHLEKEKPDRVAEFKAKAKPALDATVLKKGDFKKWQFFLGESMNPDAMHALLNYDENDEPYMLFFKDGLNEEKV